MSAYLELLGGGHLEFNVNFGALLLNEQPGIAGWGEIGPLQDFEEERRQIDLLRETLRKSYNEVFGIEDEADRAARLALERARMERLRPSLEQLVEFAFEAHKMREFDDDAIALLLLEY